jgi:hypothetical protein
MVGRTIDRNRSGGLPVRLVLMRSTTKENHNMRTNILEMALRELNRQVLNEVEYPDAFYKVATALELNTREKHELMSMYDKQGWN